MTVPDDLVERVARVICDVRDPIEIANDEPYTAWNGLLPEWREYFLAIARAAILETLRGIREPTSRQKTVPDLDKRVRDVALDIPMTPDEIIAVVKRVLPELFDGSAWLAFAKKETDEC